MQTAPEKAARGTTDPLAAPPDEAQAEGAGLVEVGASTGKSAWRRRLAPRHRQAVKSFFRPKSQKE